jgi:glycogen operon protein
MPTRNMIQSGRPFPLGATTDGTGTNFAVFSAHATAMEICVFDRRGRRELERHRLPEYTDQVWHGFVPDIGVGDVYGIRAYGPYEPEAGHRFNPHKLLLDPYARQLVGQLRWSDALYGYRVNSARADLSFDRRDSAQAMPKARIVEDDLRRRDIEEPRVAWPRTVIYEAHVKGATKLLDRVAERDRGTFRALSNPYFIEHLGRLGVTTIELLPVHAFVQDRRLTEMKLRNYWGYNTLAFFAPEPAYLSTGELSELRAAVRSLHRAGIEVILDVVYNHTAEGSELGPTLSFRGLDNASYYRLVADSPRHCINDTGTGNTVNASHPRVLQLIADSLRYWVEAFHVDGFRFDLGVTLGREATGFDPNSGFFDVLRQDPVLSRVKLISEPWDIGPGGYQLGAHPPAFAEWNGHFRDVARRFWKSDPGQRGAFAEIVQASADLFDHDGRRPWASINFVTAHDGFTLEDWVSYHDKHNEANGEENRDGSDDNASWNWGAEGPTDDAFIRGLRATLRRAMLATLAFAHGTPMLLGGDEFARTQHGNNNAYCQDNELSWVDWSLADSEEGRAQIAFVARVFALRRQYVTLRAPMFLHGRHELAPNLTDIAWFDETGKCMDEADWTYSEGRLLGVRRAAVTDDGRIELTALLINGGHEPREFALPEPRFDWRMELDSATPERRDEPLDPARIVVEPHCVILLVAHAPASGDGNGA